MATNGNIEPTGYSGKAAAAIVGITYRQLDYWARTDLVRPSLADAQGSGSRRSYSYRDLLELKAIKNLLDAGIKLESVRDAFGYLRDHLGEDVTTVNLVISGNRSVLVHTGEELIDLLKRGQGVLNILPLGTVKDEVDAAIIDLYPATSTDSAAARAVLTARAQRSMLKHSPLDAHHRAIGAKLVPFGGWDMPLQYEAGTLAEHRACRSDAVVFDVSHLGTVRVRGTGARDMLQATFTNDLTKIGPGRAQYTHLLDRLDASVIDDIIVWWVDDATFDVMPNASNTDRVTGALAEVHADGVEIDDVTDTRAILAIQGPHAREAASEYAQTQLTSAAFAWPPSDGTTLPSRWPAPGTRARTGSSARCRCRLPAPFGRRYSTPTSNLPVSGPAIRCGSKPGFRCTATSSARASRPSRRTWVGSSAGPKGHSEDEARSIASERPGLRGCCGVSGSMGGALRVPDKPSVGTASRSVSSRAATSHRCSSRGSRSPSSAPMSPSVSR